jgi:hypothetical protein
MRACVPTAMSTSPAARLWSTWARARPRTEPVTWGGAVCEGALCVEVWRGCGVGYVHSGAYEAFKAGRWMAGRWMAGRWWGAVTVPAAARPDQRLAHATRPSLTSAMRGSLKPSSCLRPAARLMSCTRAARPRWCCSARISVGACTLVLVFLWGGVVVGGGGAAGALGKPQLLWGTGVLLAAVASVLEHGRWACQGCAP